MKRLLLILSLALFITSCEDDNDIIRAVEGPALTVAVGSAAYTDAAGAGDDIELSMTGDFGVYELHLGSEVFADLGNHGFTCEYGIGGDAFRIIKEPVQFLFVKGQ